jgi:phage shock protein PspC (stress-responsive transcriptional regulator)
VSDVGDEIRREGRVARGWFARNGLTRPRRRRMLAGVCAGIARRAGVEPLVVRIGFVASCFLPGPQILVYLALWILMPKDPKP